MKRLKNYGNILFWITLISPIISFALASLIGEVKIFGVAGIIRYSWIMWLFIPIGILSILVGIKLKKIKKNYKKNFIIAFICVPLLIILGSYRFIFSNVSYNTDKVISIEQATNLNLPNKIKIATNEFNSYNLSYLKIINKESQEEFEQELKVNTLWEKELNLKIKSLLPFDIQFEVEAFDYFVFFNLTNKEYNIFPSDGEYNCIFIAYDYELQRLIILDNLKINIT